jgi:hypothetical protein
VTRIIWDLPVPADHYRFMNNKPNKDEDESLKSIIDGINAERMQMSTDARALCREGFEMSLSTIIGIAMGEDSESSANAKIKANDNLGKWGYGQVKIYLPNAEFLMLVARVSTPFIPDRAKFKEWMTAIYAAIDQHYA